MGASGGLSRRKVLGLGIGVVAAAAVSACGAGAGAGAGAGGPVGPTSPAVASFAAAQRRRFPGGRLVEHVLDAAPGMVDIGGLSSAGWFYGGVLPGPLLRVAVGDRLRVRVRNGLPEATTVHWHGIVIRNDMDGVAGVTQPPIAGGQEFTYEFVLPDPGMYWYHSHGDARGPATRSRIVWGADRR
jgi:FtsP/CotA-like multicopper oxidase with cupredoxin domain